jgi:hypothetical protein
MNKIVELKIEETKAVTGGNKYDVGVISRPLATREMSLSFNQAAFAQSLFVA